MGIALHLLHSTGANKYMNDFTSILNELNDLPEVRGKSFSLKKAGALALFDLSHEHALSIVVLLERNNFGSAYALLRSCIEAYIRGVWLYKCAPEDKIGTFINKSKKWPSLSQQVKAIDQLLDTEGFFSGRFLGKTMGQLDALNHGVSLQIQRRLEDRSLGIVEKPQEKTEFIKEVVLISILAHAGMVEIIKSKDMADKLDEISTRYRFLTSG